MKTEEIIEKYGLNNEFAYKFLIEGDTNDGDYAREMAYLGVEEVVDLIKFNNGDLELDMVEDLLLELRPYCQYPTLCSISDVTAYFETPEDMENYEHMKTIEGVIYEALTCGQGGDFIENEAW